jgi:hypothetical protein
MHLITSAITFLSLIAFTLANPIIPTSITTNFNGYSVSTPPHTQLKPTYTHDVHHSFTHTMTRLTGAYRPSVYPKLTATLAVYGRNEVDADKHCTHVLCAPHFCVCVAWGGNASVEPVVENVDESTIASLTARDEVARDETDADKHCLQIKCTGRLCRCIAWGDDASIEPVVEYVDDASVDEASLTGRDEASAIFDLAGRDGDASEDGCKWACFGTACECIPNASRRSATLSKTFLVLAMVGAAITAARLV